MIRAGSWPRLRRRILGRRRRRVRRDLPHRRVSRRYRTLTIGKRRACLVLFRRARGGRDCAPDGLLPHHRNDEAPPPARDDIRLFPNQDTLPRGGFGNLIALPLQHEARERGNTVFVDDRIVPHADQWAYLAGLPRMEPLTVEAIAREASARGQVIGLRIAPTGEEEDEVPWEAPPSRRPRPSRIDEPLPSEVRAVLAQRVFVEKARLPSALLNQIKRLAAFQNPEFYQRQKMRLSTAVTARVVACAEDHPQHVALPRGCVGDLKELLAGHGVRLRLDDQRVLGESFPVRFEGHLTEVLFSDCPPKRSGRSAAGSGRPAGASTWPCSRASRTMAPSTTSWPTVM